MRLALAAVLFFTFAIPARAYDPSCIVTAATPMSARYFVHVPHEDVALGRFYTAEPPIEVFTQHYITATIVITIPNTTPPITHTAQTFTYSETLATLGYSPLAAHPPDYAYVMRSWAPFRVWSCATMDARPHLFIPIVTR